MKSSAKLRDSFEENAPKICSETPVWGRVDWIETHRVDPTSCTYRHRTKCLHEGSFRHKHGHDKNHILTQYSGASKKFNYCAQTHAPYWLTADCRIAALQHSFFSCPTDSWDDRQAASGAPIEILTGLSPVLARCQLGG
jgi:hypothetical protein